jgi:hypothetical protein
MKPLSFMLILLDGARIDYSLCYGATQSFTAAVDQLTKDDLLFESA